MAYEIPVSLVIQTSGLLAQHLIRLVKQGFCLFVILAGSCVCLHIPVDDLLLA